jgi:hypothetical protein
VLLFYTTNTASQRSAGKRRDFARPDKRMRARCGFQPAALQKIASAQGHTKMRDIVNFMNFAGKIAPDSATCRLKPVGFA